MAAAKPDPAGVAPILAGSVPPDGDLADLFADLAPILAEAAQGDGRLPSERALAQSLGVTRRRLRLALDGLARQGVLFRRHGQGTFVTPPPPPDKARHRLLAGRLTLAQLMDVRRQIEPRLAELAADRARPADLGPLEALMQRSCAAQTAADYDLADEGFHYRIAELAGNALFLEIYDLIRQTRHEAGWRMRRAEINSPAMIAILGQQHRQIFAAIAGGEPARAGQAQRAHMDFVAGLIQRR